MPDHFENAEWRRCSAFTRPTFDSTRYHDAAGKPIRVYVLSGYPNLIFAERAGQEPGGYRKEKLPKAFRGLPDALEKATAWCEENASACGFQRIEEAAS